MKKFIVILLLIAFAFSCVSCTSSKENFMMANEIKTHIIYDTISDNDLNEKVNTWLREHSDVKIIEIQYDTYGNSYPACGSVMIIYQD